MRHKHQRKSTAFPQYDRYDGKDVFSLADPRDGKETRIESRDGEKRQKPNVTPIANTTTPLESNETRKDGKKRN